ncbi:hypothetical protein O6H91_07G008000 [Diphasiastrum complanatum]|uniref:Uncharacterized protein n=1 Tax=Diphasiastrum complanatum TaxID=34168 RepID=A0ACC2D238_DIPCM|nr:hypothetical protein O6H91_07G008000 [Diphasiastrum complanatum]
MAPSSSDWMLRWKELLASATNAVEVATFDYPFLSGGKKKAPPKAEKLVDFHFQEIKKSVSRHSGHPLVFVGKSMGSRVGCMVAKIQEIKPVGIVCLGYPLKGANGALRDETLLKLSVPVIFVQITTMAMRLVTFVTRKRRVLALFRTFSTLNLKKPAPTRFAFYFLVLERLVVVKDALRRMVSSVAFRDFTDLPHSAFFQSIVYDDEFYRAAEEITGILLSIFRVLRLVDREGCTLGLIYEFMDRIGEGILLSALDEHKRREISRIWEARWDYFHRPIHAVAHMLHPLWRSTRERDDPELHRGWVEYTERVWPRPG